MKTNTSETPTSAPLSAPACIPWVVLMTTESLIIVIFNLWTIIAFAKQRQLHRRRTYLLIRNLAIIDLLVGGISGPLEWNVGDSCDLWMYNRMIGSWFFLLKVSLLHIFSMASLCNLAAISLERMHAIICPPTRSDRMKFRLSSPLVPLTREETRHGRHKTFFFR